MIDVNGLVATIGPIFTLIIVVAVGAVMLARAQSRAIEEQTRAQKIINDQFAILGKTIDALQGEVRVERERRVDASLDAQKQRVSDEAAITSLKTDLSELCERFDAQSLELATLRERFDAQRTELATVRAEKDALGVRIADLERQLNAVVRERDTLATENVALKDENHKLEKRVKALETEQHDMSQRLAAQDAKLKALEHPTASDTEDKIA